MNFKMFLIQTVAVFSILLLLIYIHVYYEQIDIEKEDVLELENYFGLDLQRKKLKDDKPCCVDGFYQNGQCKLSNHRKTFYFHDYMMSYEDCISVNNPCLDHYCPAGMECYMFVPNEDCVGCISEPNCRRITKQN